MRSLTQLTAILLALLVFPFPTRARGSRVDRPQFSTGAPVRSLARLFVDLDGDQRPDQIDLLSHDLAKTIRIELEEHRDYLSIASDSRRGQLIPYDIDHDSDLDLIWAVRGDRKHAVIYINDGHANFRVQPDTRRYATELRSLIPDDDTDDQQLLKLRRTHKRVTASSSSKILFTAKIASRSTEAQTSLISEVSTFIPQSDSLGYLRKRGPPVVLS